MPSNTPPTPPSWAWNSSMTLALKSCGEVDIGRLLGTCGRATIRALPSLRAGVRRLPVLGRPRRMRFESHRRDRIRPSQRIDLSPRQCRPERFWTAELFVAARQALAEQGQVEVAVIDCVYVERRVCSLEACLCGGAGARGCGIRRGGVGAGDRLGRRFGQVPAALGELFVVLIDAGDT